MATAQSTGKARPTRNRPADRRSKLKTAATSPKARHETNRSAAPPPGHGSEKKRDGDLRELIEDERARLQTAEAVLACLHFALTYDDYFEPNEAPSYPEVAQVAMGLIRTAVDHLDPLYVGRQIRATAAGAQPIDD